MKPWTALPLLFLFVSAATAQDAIELQKLDLRHVRQGWGEPQIDRSIREKPLAIAGEKFAHGVGTHATSLFWIQLDGQTERFQASVGVDDAAGGPGSVGFHVIGDGKELWASGVMRPNEKAKTIDLDLRGVKRLLLLVDDAGDGIGFDHADWANARFTFHGRAPRAIDPPDAPREEPVLLTPPPGRRRRSTGPRSMPAAQNIPSSIAFPPRAGGRWFLPPKDFRPDSRWIPIRASSAGRLPGKAPIA